MKITETWLEGVGSLNGLLRESCFSMTPCDNNYELLCFQENNVLLYSNPAYDNCFIDTLLVSVKHPKMGIDISIYPNPARDKMTIYSQSSRILEVEIYDLTGTCVYQNLNAGSNRVEMETHNLPKGMYVLKIRDEGNTISRRIVIQ
jgi:hypothetical protein